MESFLITKVLYNTDEYSEPVLEPVTLVQETVIATPNILFYINFLVKNRINCHIK